MKTKIHFRKWSNGEVVALMPEIPFDNWGHHCMSYSLIGEHGGAATDIPNTVPATPEEYAETLRVLTLRGYDVHPVSRITSAMHAIRRNAVLRSA
jgi:hypothetical protein